MPRKTAPVSAVNELAQRDRARVRDYVRKVAELERLQRRAVRGSGGDELRAKTAEERGMLLELVEAAQSFIREAGHKAGIGTARRLEALVRDAALHDPKALENGTLAGEARPGGWNLESADQTARPRRRRRAGHS